MMSVALSLERPLGVVLSNPEGDVGHDCDQCMLLNREWTRIQIPFNAKGLDFPFWHVSRPEISQRISD